jgi:hypothetical protein
MTVLILFKWGRSWESHGVPTNNFLFIDLDKWLFYLYCETYLTLTKITYVVIYNWTSYSNYSHYCNFL